MSDIHLPCKAGGFVSSLVIIESASSTSNIAFHLWASLNMVRNLLSGSVALSTTALFFHWLGEALYKGRCNTSAILSAALGQ